MRTIKELQEDRVEFSLDCFDRIYFNLYIPMLCSLGGIAFFIRNILDWAVPIPAAFKEYRDFFVRDVYEFAENNQLEVYTFDKKEQNSKEEIARKNLEKFPWKEGVFFIGKAQEKVKIPQGSWIPRLHDPKRKWFKLRFGFGMVNQYYFYFRDEDWGVGFIKFSSYAPFAGRFYINAHEFVKCQLEKEGIDFEPLDNGVGKCENPKRAQAIANKVTASRLEKLVKKWMGNIPTPIDYLRLQKPPFKLKYVISMLQMEVARTQLWKRAADGLHFFEQVIRENIDLGRPEKVGLIFGKRITKPTRAKHRFMSRVMTYGVIPVFHVFYKSTKLKQYYKEGKALRNEVTINNPRELGIGKTLNTENFRALREVGIQTIERLLRTEVLSHDPSVSQEMIGSIESAAEVAGRRISPLPRSNTRVRALFAALISCHLIAQGFRNRDLKGRVAHLLGRNPNEITTGQMSYDLRRLRGHGIIEKVEGTHRYELTEEGLRLAMFITRVERRVYREGMPLIMDDESHNSKLRKAFDRFEIEIDKLMEENLALAR